MNMLRRLSTVDRATAVSLFAAVAGQSILVVSGVLVAHLLGPENRGHLALIVFMPVVLLQVAHLGLPQAVTYYAARDSRRTWSIARSVRRVVALQALAVVALHLLMLPVFLRGANSTVWSAALQTLIVGPAILGHTYALAILQGQRRFVAYNVLRMGSAALYGLGAVVLSLLGAKSLVLVAIAWTGSWVSVAIVTVIVTYRGVTRDLNGESPAVSSMIRFGLRGFLGSVSPIETLRLDQAVIGLFLPPTALGLYVVGLAFTNLPLFIAQSVGAVAYPSIAAATDRAAARHATWRFVATTAGACALVVTPIWLGASFLVPFFFGQSFAASIPVTRILLVGSLFGACKMTLADTTRGLGQPHLSTFIEVLSWFWLFPSLAIMGSQWGIEGVGLALASSAALSLLIFVVLTIRGLRRWEPPRSGIKEPAPVGARVAQALEGVPDSPTFSGSEIS